MLTGELKGICINHLQEYVAGFQERRAKVTDEIVNEFMSARPLEWNGNPKVPRTDLVVPVTNDGAADGGKDGNGEISKSQQKRLLKQKQNEEKKAAKAAEKEAKAAAGS